MDGIVTVIGITVITVVVLSIRLVRHFAADRRTHTKPLKCRIMQSFSTDDPEVVIVGAGITGASLAAALGKKGRRVVVIERDMSPPKNTFKGESLQPGGVQTLIDMGLKEVVEDFNSEGAPWTGLHIQDLEIGLETKIPFSQLGRNSHHANYLQPLRKDAKSESTVTFIEGVATEVLKEESRVTGVQYREKGSDEQKLMRAPLTVICDGPYSNLRKWITGEMHMETEAHHLGIEITHAHDPDLYVTDIYIGHPFVQTARYSLGDMMSRVVFMFPHKPPENVRGFIESKLLSDLPEYLRMPIVESLERCPRPQYIQGKRFPAISDSIPGVLVLGDALNTRDGYAGTGMTVCFKDVQFWLRALGDIPDLSKTTKAIACKNKKSQVLKNKIN